jgi:hypothetical protein
MVSCKQAARAITFSVLTLLFGCADQPQLYDGPKLPPEKVAVIKGQTGFLPGSTTISISSVDGKSFKPNVESVEVLPGRHVLGVHYYWHLAGGRYGDGHVTVEAHAGKTYELNAKQSEDGQLVSFSLSEAPAKQ